MRYLSVCSGIEAASVAWDHLGWEPVAFSEIDKFPSAVLSQRFPGVPNLGNMEDYKEWDIVAIDVLVGGTPCQSFSVAGLRKGMSDPRGNLALVYCRILERFRPKWFVWENVPGVLSSAGGRDFGSFLGAVAELGYGFSYRVLDAQFFGVPQRRRRVFVVGCLGDWRRPAAVLFEPESMRGDTAKGKSKKKDVTGTLSSRTTGGGGLGTDFDLAGGLQVAGGYRMTAFGEYADDDTASTVKARDYKDATDLVTCTLPASNGGVSSGMHPVVAFAENSRSEVRLEGGDGNRTGALSTGGGKPGQGTPMIANSMAVRRLTPLECERLQGFPDDWTAITYRGKPAADGPRYKAIGNSMAVPVMRWIGERLATVG